MNAPVPASVAPDVALEGLADLGERAIGLAADALVADGVSIGWTACPADARALAAILGRLHERGLAVRVRGGGSHDALGNPPRRADLVLSTARLAGIRELDIQEGVVQVGAGSRLVAVAEALTGSGWRLALDPPDPRATLGGSLATDLPGLACRRARDVVLGLEVVLGSGQRVRCGGRVVKNVTGYDLAKLFVGSLGSLAVIEAAWLRLEPEPACSLLCAAPLAAVFASDAPTAADTQVLAAARRPSVRIAAQLDASLARSLRSGQGSQVPLLVLELAGDEAAVRADERWLRDRLGAAPCEPGWRAHLAAQLVVPPDEPALRFVVFALASRLGAAARSLTAAGAQVLAHPGHGVLRARFALSALDEAGEAALTAAFAAASRAATLGGGAWLLESGPLAAKRGRDVFGTTRPAPEQQLIRDLKQRYDPGGVLNPGRFLGGL